MLLGIANILKADIFSKFQEVLVKAGDRCFWLLISLVRNTVLTLL